MSKISNEVKMITYKRNIKLKDLAALLSKKMDKPYSGASLTQKLRNETITYKEIKIIAKELGYKVRFIDIEEESKYPFL